MLAVGLQQAKLYSKRPCLLAKDLNDESKDVYWVEDASLPCLSCKDNPKSGKQKENVCSSEKIQSATTGPEKDRKFLQIRPRHA